MIQYQNNDNQNKKTCFLFFGLFFLYITYILYIIFIIHVFIDNSLIVFRLIYIKYKIKLNKNLE